MRAHKAYFDFDDRPLIASESITATFNASTAYTTSSYITHGGKFWVRTVAGTGNAPSTTSAYWKEVRKWTEWASGTTYQIGTLVRYNGVTIWKATGVQQDKYLQTQALTGLEKKYVVKHYNLVKLDTALSLPCLQVQIKNQKDQQI